MRDYEKMMSLINAHPDKSNEYILNSSGLNPGMSCDEAGLEYESLSKLRGLSPDTINKLKNIISERSNYV